MPSSELEYFDNYVQSISTSNSALLPNITESKSSKKPSSESSTLKKSDNHIGFSHND